jgi:Tol biopolymer transport system component
MIFVGIFLLSVSGQGSSCLADVLKNYLSDAESGQFDDVRPTWSPDGKLIAFERRHKSQASSRQELYCLNRIKEEPLTVGKLKKFLIIAEITQPMSGTSSPSLDRGFEEEVPEIDLEKGAYVGDFCWAGNSPTPDGRYEFVFTQGVNLYVGAIDANLKLLSFPPFVKLTYTKEGKLIILLFSPFVKLFSEDWKPIASTDATWGRQNFIAFVSGFSGNGDIYLKAPNQIPSSENDPGERLTQNEGVELSPKWSPDGTKLVYSSVRKKEKGGANADIYLLVNVLQPQKREERQLTDTQEDQKTPSWAQEQGTDELNPNWSPDGKMIAFYRLQQPDPTQPAKNYELWVMNTDGTQKQRIVTSVYPEKSGPAWLPKEFGPKLIYISENQESLHIWDVASQKEVTPKEGTPQLNDDEGIALREVSHRVMSDLACAPYREDKKKTPTVWIAYSAVNQAASGRKRIYWESFQMAFAQEVSGE